MVVCDGELEGFGSGGDDEGLGEFGQFLGLLGEGGGAVDDVGCALCVPGGGCGEVTVGDADECASSEMCGVNSTDTRHPTPNTRINGINNRPVHCRWEFADAWFEVGVEEVVGVEGVVEVAEVG
jgi:hypothetical protein